MGNVVTASSPTTPVLTPTRISIKKYVAGCQVRRHGRAYLRTEIDRLKKDEIAWHPLSYFIYDPPFPIDDEKSWGLCDQGFTFYRDPTTGIWHVMGITGRDNYPNSADVIEECSNDWASALLPQSPAIQEKVHLLKEDKSRRLVFHRGGYLHNPKPYAENFVNVGLVSCFLPIDHPDRDAHLNGDETCAGLHWQHLTKANVVETNTRKVVRYVGEHHYFGAKPLEDHPAEVSLALIMWLPIHRIEVVDSPEIQDKEPVQKALDFLAGCSMPVVVTDN